MPESVLSVAHAEVAVSIIMSSTRATLENNLNGFCLMFDIFLMFTFYGRSVSKDTKRLKNARKGTHYFYNMVFKIPSRC